MSLEISPSFLLNFSEREMNGEAKHFYQFKSFRLSVEERQLLRGDETVSLTPKAFDVLAVLVERGGHLVEKDELLRIVWSDSFVEEANVARIVHTLRKCLGEDDNGNKFIETVARKGYRFVARVDEVREPATCKSSNGKKNFVADYEKSIDINVAEKSPETIAAEELPKNGFQLAPTVADKVFAPPVREQKPETRLTLIAVGFLSVVFLLFLVSFNRQTESSINRNDFKSIAVLPLKPLAAENRDAVYELGIQDSLINKLSLVKGLKVRPLSATRQYADIEQDAAAGREQRVDYVLASNYQIADGKIRITSQLINVANGAVEEVFTVEENNSSGFAVQDAVTANLGQSVLTRLNREPNTLAAKRYTTNEEAYRLYLQGTALADKRNRKDYEKAIEYFEQAVNLDLNYAPAAYAGLANVHTAIGGSGSGNIGDFQKAKAALEKALSIDGNLAEAHSYLGEIKVNYEWDFAGAEREHQKAIELNPNSSAAHRMYALLLGFLGRFDEAIAEIKTAIDLEPASVLNHKIYGQILYYARRYDEAVVQLKRAIEMDAEPLGSYNFLRRSYRMKGEADQAFECFVRSRTQQKDDAEQIQLWKTIYAQSGWRGIYERQLEKLKEDEKNGKPNYNQLAGIYNELGNRDQAFDYLEKVFDKRGWTMVSLKIEPGFDSLRSDPRFDDLVKRVGLK
jgi:DNA-binding winged helix-turn-helix (wHTH) protein/tetratricopeptide (TPR) repeat protein